MAEKATQAQIRAAKEALHDMTCPEGAECRSRVLHVYSHPWFDAEVMANAVVKAGD